MNNLGIMVIDMQEAFFLDDYFLDKGERKNLVRTQTRLINSAIKKKIPVFTMEYKDRGKTIPELQGILSEARSYFIPKFKDNAFYENSELISLLERWKIKNLVLTGIHGYACVLETAKGAKKEGINLFTSEELMDETYFNCIRWYKENTDYSKKLDELLVKISNPNL